MSRVEKGGTRFKPQIRPRAGIRSSQPGPSAPASSLESAQPGSLSQSVGPQAQPQAQAEAEAEAEAQAEAQAQAQPQSQSQSKEPHSMGGARGASRYPFAAEEEDEEEDRLPTTASSSKSQLLPIIASKSGRNVNVSASATNRAPKAIPAPTAPSPSPSPPPQARPALASAQSREPQSNGGTGALPPQPPAAEAAAIGESRDGRHGQTDGQAGAALDKSGGAKSKGDDMSSKDRGAVASSAGGAAASQPSLSATSPPSTSGASSPSTTRAPMPPPPAPASRTSSNNQNNAAQTQSFVRAPRTIGLMPIKPLVSRASSASLRAPSLSPAPGLRADRSSATPAPSAAAASARLRGMSATPMPESLSRRESMAPPEIASARKAREASVLSEAGIRGATPARVQAPTSPVVARGDGAATLERGALSGIESAQSAPSTKARAPWEMASVETSAREQNEAGSAQWDALVRGEAATGVPQNDRAAPPKRPRGRPKKSNAAVNTAVDGDFDRQAEIGSEVPQRRPRGRPKKLNNAAATVDADVGSNAGPASQGEAPAKRPRGRPKKAGAAAAAAAAAVSVPQHQEQETSADGSRKSRSRAEIVSPLRPESTSQAHLDGDAEEQAQEDSDDSAEEYFPSTTARRGRGGGRTRGGAGTRQSTKDASVSAHSVPESGKSKRRAKLKLPDDAPKRPANAYMRFSAQQRALHWADQNGASFGEVAQKIAERWAEVSAAEKGERAQMAKQELEAWRMNMVQWKRDNPEWAEKLDARKRKMGTVTDGETADEGATTDASAGATERKATKTPRKRSVRKPTHGEGSDSEAAGSTKRRRGGGGGKRKNVGISDDESAYAAELAAVGGNERLLEVSQGTRMADLSQPEVRMGRAGARTFELRRTYRKMVKDRKKELPERRMLAARKDKGSLRAEEVEEEERRKRSSKSLSTARKEVQQAQNEDEVQEEEVFDLDSDGEPIAPSSPAGSASPAPSGFSNNSSAHALKNNKNSVQVRMSNGRLVLDESTLQVDRAAEYEGEDRIVIEENEKDKFINSASFSDRRGHQRWDKEQTLAFYAAVSQWGTDFEMIARMFPSRTRKEIKQKWTSEERRNAHMIDAAFARRLPVDLQSYGEIAGVDLSGPPPVIKARTPPPIDFNAVNLKSKKKEGDEEEVVGEDEEARSERELGPNGEEIVEEGEDPIDAKFALSQERSKRNTSATPSVGAATQSGAESSAAGSDVEAVTEGEDDEDLPESTALLKRKRATSNASEGSASASVPTISRPRAGSTTSATSAQTRRRAGSSSAPAASTSGAATAAGAKQRKTEAEKKRAERDSRQEREKRHRRNVPDVGEEEVVGVIEPQTRRQVPRRG